MASAARRNAQVTISPRGGDHPIRWVLESGATVTACPLVPWSSLLVGARGFEPLTSSASRKRSTPELSALPLHCRQRSTARGPSAPHPAARGDREERWARRSSSSKPVVLTALPRFHPAKAPPRTLPSVSHWVSRAGAIGYPTR